MTAKIRIALTDWTGFNVSSPPTQYRLSGRQFHRSKDPTNTVKLGLLKKRYKKKAQKKQTTQHTAKHQTHTHAHTKNTENPLVYNNTMVW